ncbi:MAG: PLD nuclease N-terminal domain-containing protein [Bacillota bacterium]|nr:PLDc_N domain-containing protein [Bacillota bacterium]HOB90868.1 PLD nuclease N-terminal domain-containing protein [Bacillota bacterium]HPZ54956.1 PLD nuclease N-terminal domain-containing protein [Bacillota bacterium]HQD18842.1 PLD nuclease N-terminal domain-containing protein [Bacillota bacterium]
MDTKAVLDMLKVVWPVVVLNYALVIWALVDLVRRERVKYMPKLLWGAIVIFIQIIGPVSYLAFGRGE